MSWIHKDLNIQTTYRIRVSLDGHIGKTHHELVELASETGGTTKVYANKETYGSHWREITRVEFLELARQLLEHNDLALD